MATEIVKTGSGQVALAELPLSALAIAVLQKTSNAEFAAHEFFQASISNDHTRRAYGRIVSRFLAWCDERGFALHNITPGMAGEYMQTLAGAAPTKNQGLAALRNFFDFLVNRHAVPLNSFSTLRGIKYSVTEGKTPERSASHMMALSTVLSLRCIAHKSL